MAKTLTEAALERFKPDSSRRREIPDGLLTGLYFVLQPSGARSWAVRYRAGKTSRKLTLGSYPKLRLSDAREAAREALLKAKKGEDPAAEKREAKATASADGIAGLHRFENVVRTFFVRYAKDKNRSWRESARLLGLVPGKSKKVDPAAFVAAKGSVLAKWGDRNIAEIKRSEIIAFVDCIVDRGAPIAANRTLAALSKLFNWSIERGLIDASPVAAISPPSPEKSRDRVLSDDEIRWLWKATEAIGFPFGPIARMLLLTGQRRNEVGGMTHGELDGHVWTIPKERAKNNQAHLVPLSIAALEELAYVPKIAGRRGFVFTTTGDTPVSGWSRAKDAIDREMHAAARRCTRERGDDPDAVSIPHWTLHDLRRTAASGMARLGIAVHVVERLLNHRSGTIRGVAAVYNRFDYLSEREAAAEAWGRGVIKIVTDEPAPRADLPAPKKAAKPTRVSLLLSSPRGKAGDNNDAGRPSGQFVHTDAASFTDDTAKATGKDERTVRRDVVPISASRVSSR